MSFLKGVQSCLYEAIDSVALTYGIEKIDDELVTRETKHLPYIYYYDGKKYVTVHKLQYNDKCWGLSLSKHCKDKSEPLEFYINFDGERCDEYGKLIERTG